VLVMIGRVLAEVVEASEARSADQKRVVLR